MHKIEELKINDDFTTMVEITGPDEGTECIVFSHGFGVTRDSRGMFTDLVEHLSDRFVCVQFEYTVLDGKETWVNSYHNMEQTLEKVVEWVHAEYRPLSIHIIGHSLGCVLAAGQSTTFHKQLYLAPPTEPIAERLETYFRQKSGTTVTEDGDVAAARSDGGVTYIAKTFFDELRPIIPVDQYAMTNGDITVVEARDDEIITNQTEVWEPMGNYSVTSIPGDHNFQPPHRALLVQTVLDYFGE